MTRFCGRKVSLWMFLLVAIPVLVLSTSLVYANDVDEWTIMVYVDGDNDLEDAAWDDLEEMESVGSITGVNVVVQLDDWRDYDTWRYSVTGVSKGADKPYYTGDIVQTLPEQDMADPDVLTDFIDWAANAYPAEKYMLVLWNHGDGWRKRTPLTPRGVIWDDTSGTFMTMADLISGLDAIEGVLDIVGFDACLMEMVEVAYELYWSWAEPKYMVGSEEVEPGNGWPYDVILTELAANPSMAPVDLASLIPGAYVASYAPDTGVTQSAIDLSKMEELSFRIDDLALAILSSAYSQEILDAFLWAQSYYSHWDYLDLYDLCDLIYQNVPDCQVEASAVMSYVGEVVVVESHSPEGGVEYSHGVSIYGELPPEDDYQDLWFAEDTNWDEALTNLSVGPPPQNVVAGDGFAGLVPLTWDPFEGSDPDYYRVYRSEVPGGPYDSIAEVDTADRDYFDCEDYVDQNVTNGWTYYYVIKGVISDEESDPSEEVSATPSVEGKVLCSGYATSPPTIDGYIQPGEWDEAADLDIALYQGGILYPVHLKVMNDDGYLYVALDDQNADFEDWSDFYIFFDDDNNGQWPPDPSTTEGDFDIEAGFGLRALFWGIYGSYPDNINELDSVEANGVSAGYSYVSGNLQYEVAINLETSNLTARPGNTIGFWVAHWAPWPIDSTYYYTTYDAAWPLGSVWVDPKTYAKLALASQEKPLLSWTGEASYENNGLNPEIGNTATDFVYRVKYSDGDNNPPLSGYPKVHILREESEITGSPFSMQAVDPGDEDYTDGKLYSCAKSGLTTGNSYSYYFEAWESCCAEATGEPTQPKSGPIVDTDVPETVLTETPGCKVVGDDFAAEVQFAWEGWDNLTPPDQLVYNWKLEGYDDEWSSWTGVISTVYLLHSGKYTFKVRAKDEAGNYPGEDDPETASWEFLVWLPVSVYPNPFRPNDGDTNTGSWNTGVIFENLVAGSRVTIYTLAGELVYSSGQVDNHQWVWPARNQMGSKVASGIYFYVVSYDGKREIGKIVVMK